MVSKEPSLPPKYPFPQSLIVILKTLLDDPGERDDKLSDMIILATFGILTDLAMSTEMDDQERKMTNKTLHYVASRIRLEKKYRAGLMKRLKATHPQPSPLFLSIQYSLYHTAKSLKDASAPDFILHIGGLDRLLQLIAQTELRTSEAAPLRWCLAKCMKFLNHPDLLETKLRAFALMGILSEQERERTGEATEAKD